MRAAALTVLGTFALSGSICRADNAGADFTQDAQFARLDRTGRVKQVAGGTALALGLASFVAGVAILTKEALPTPLGCFDCSSTEIKRDEARMRPDLVAGGGVAIGLGVIATVGGSITLAVGTQERKAARRQLSFSVAPSFGGANALAKLSF